MHSQQKALNAKQWNRTQIAYSILDNFLSVSGFLSLTMNAQQHIYNEFWGWYPSRIRSVSMRYHGMCDAKNKPFHCQWEERYLLKNPSKLLFSVFPIIMKFWPEKHLARRRSLTIEVHSSRILQPMTMTWVEWELLNNACIVHWVKQFIFNRCSQWQNSNRTPFTYVLGQELQICPCRMPF